MGAVRPRQRPHGVPRRRRRAPGAGPPDGRPWWAEAEKYKVLPLDGSMQIRLAAERPQTSRPRDRFVYYPHGAVVPVFAAPQVYNRPWSIEADVELAGGDSGVLVAQGGDAGGYTFHMVDGRLRFVYNYGGRDQFVLESPGTGRRRPSRPALRVRAHRRHPTSASARDAGPRPAVRRRRRSWPTPSSRTPPRCCSSWRG